ncbi:MAG: CoA-binding protein [Pigmentiphaga sp.]|uniref:CoA-binding protein n=1 Tax=Pigmentiphaga sp. TaxID=1977564 RepID=UPI0029AFE242|nr:CoA-binding protein [Pigmentiphaga sp.]MDX3906288.1 CoA-binding protein [Pigmentiphaga sp.]
MLTDQQLKDLFSSTRTVAVVGLSPRADRPSHGVAQALQAHGLRIVPINPAAAAGGQAILGEKAWPDLGSAAAYLREQGIAIDIVDVFRPSADVPPIADDAVLIGARALWMQLGVVNEQAAERARAAGLVVEMNRCLKVEWGRVMR